MATGEITEHHQAAEYLLEEIRVRALKGESRSLMLANRAIDAYRHRQAMAA